VVDLAERFGNRSNITVEGGFTRELPFSPYLPALS
jgi:hypothetical protein